MSRNLLRANATIGGVSEHTTKRVWLIAADPERRCFDRLIEMPCPVFAWSVGRNGSIHRSAEGPQGNRLQPQPKRPEPRCTAAIESGSITSTDLEMLRSFKTKDQQTFLLGRIAPDATSVDASLRSVNAALRGQRNLDAYVDVPNIFSTNAKSAEN